MSCHKVGHFAKVCRSRGVRQHPGNTLQPPRPQALPSHQYRGTTRELAVPQLQPGANSIRVQSQHHSQANHLQLYKVDDTATEPAPTITVRVSSPAGFHYIDVLPDSGADISAAGQEMLQTLGHHTANILPSNISPRTVNGSSMVPLGKIPITIQLGALKYKDELHIYPGVTGALISWKAAKGLGILPPYYPQPAVQLLQGDPQKVTPACTLIQQTENQSVAQTLVAQYPAVFDGQIHVMEGEKFHITP